MRLLYLKTQIVSFSLLVISLIVIKARQRIPSIHGPLEFIKRQGNSKSDPVFNNYDAPRKNLHLNNHYKFSYFSNSPLKAGLLFHGGPCCPMQAIGCGGFSCGCGIAFPISCVSCCNERNKPGEENTTAKRFDITGFPAAHKVKPLTRKQPLPTKDEVKFSKPQEEEYADDEGPKVNTLNLDKGPKASEEDSFRHPFQHQPWHPVYLHKPLIHPLPLHFHFIPNYTPSGRELPSFNYWRFQRYFPHFIRWKMPWRMDPYDVRNLHYYPEYQYDDDAPFTQSAHHFKPRPRLREHNDGASEVKLFDQQDELQEDEKHSKHRVGQVPEEDRKMVDSPDRSGNLSGVQDDLTESEHKVNSQTNPVNPNDGHRKMVSSQSESRNNFDLDNNTVEGVPENEINDDAAEEDAAKNYPEYASELNTAPFLLSAEKRQRSEMKPINENAIKQRGQGFDLDAISNTYSKKVVQTKDGRKIRKGHKVSSGFGDLKIKYDTLPSHRT